jgi:hypothetical protein
MAAMTTCGSGGASAEMPWSPVAEGQVRGAEQAATKHVADNPMAVRRKDMTIVYRF